MEHIVQFAIGIDDEAIRKRIEQTAEKQVVDSIKEDIGDMIFKKNRWNDEKCLQSWVSSIVVEAVMEHKDDIIREAASKLCEYMKRTKAVREAVAGAVEETKNE
mgnify:CR=1 FL=1